MNRIQMKESWIHRLGIKLITLSLFFAGCAPAPTPTVESATPTSPPLPSPTAPVEATQPSGWETYTSQDQCGYAISHPPDMEGTSQATDSWILSISQAGPSGPSVNFIYVSVIPDDFQGGPGIIYNYDPAETETLLNMQVGESKSLREDLGIDQGFTYTRLLDANLLDGAAQTYENTQPWEFPPGTKEIRYYLKGNGCTYMIGGYFDTTGSQEPGAISEALFDEIIASFHLNP